jgi:crotonobetainyl-CoA:carnitine CoA-transferase CaiB-like acyl-CoA transferase
MGLLAPLSGVRIISLALNLPGPVAAARLRDLGAQVMKIEPPSGDPLQFAQPSAYAELHHGIEVRKMDLKVESERIQLNPLLDECDVLLTSSRLGALERLGLGWKSLSEKYPRLCRVAIVGAAPPNADVPGHDLTYQASKGLVFPPSMPVTLLADLGGAMEAVCATLSLLLRRSGREPMTAEERDAVVPLESAAEFFSMPVRWGLCQAGGMLSGGLPQYNLYACRSGWVAVAALEPHFWMRMQAKLEVEHPTQAELGQIFLKMTATEWEVWASQNDLPIVAVRQ